MGHSRGYSEYIRSDIWRSKSTGCMALAGYRCCLFPWLRSRHCHHLTYRNFKHETPCRDTVGLSVTAHKIVHWYPLWKTPLRGCINFYLRLSYFTLVVINSLFRGQ